MLKLVYYAGLFVDAMDMILLMQSTGKKVCTETCDGRLINIKPGNFKFVINRVDPDADAVEALNRFRRLGFLVTEKGGGRNTNVQKINQKPTRVISVNRLLYEAVKADINSEMLLKKE